MRNLNSFFTSLKKNVTEKVAFLIERLTFKGFSKCESASVEDCEHD